MPKLGMEPIRRDALVKATITEIGRAGTLDVTVSQIAKRAGMSSALAHHYFGGKEQIFMAAMRHILTVFGAEVQGALAMAHGPRDRLEAIIRACFGSTQFRREVVGAWLNFYVLAQTSPSARRLLTIYQKRLHSNLMHELKPLMGAQAHSAAQGIAAFIDGLYVRQGLNQGPLDREASVAMVSEYLDMILQHRSRP